MDFGHERLPASRFDDALPTHRSLEEGDEVGLDQLPAHRPAEACETAELVSVIAYGHVYGRERWLVRIHRTSDSPLEIAGDTCAAWIEPVPADLDEHGELTPHPWPDEDPDDDEHPDTPDEDE